MQEIPDNYIKNVDEVRKIIQNKPAYRQEILKLPEDCTTDDNDEIVEDSAVDNQEPGTGKKQEKYISFTKES